MSLAEGLVSLGVCGVGVVVVGVVVVPAAVGDFCASPPAGELSVGFDCPCCWGDGCVGADAAPAVCRFWSSRRMSALR